MAPCDSFLTAQQTVEEIAKRMYNKLEENYPILMEDVKNCLAHYLEKFGVCVDAVKNYIQNITSEMLVYPEEREEFLARATKNSNIELLFAETSEE